MGRKGKKDNQSSSSTFGKRLLGVLELGLYGVVLTVSTALFIWEYLAYARHMETIPDVDMQAASSLQTENGFYYSFYREMTNGGFFTGLSKAIVDKRSEFPDELNAIRRFNIYQEVLLAAVYWMLRSIGIGWIRPWNLFMYTIIGLNSAGFAALGVLVAQISGSVLAVISFAVLSFLNRFQIGRLGNYTSMNLREMWALPVLWLQLLCLWQMLVGGAKTSSGSTRIWSVWFLSTFAFIVLWQFSPFLLLLQVSALYFVYLVCGYRHRQWDDDWDVEEDVRSDISSMINGYLGALLLASLVQFVSPYVLTSPCLFQLVAIRVAMTTMGPFQRRGDKAGTSNRSIVMAWLLWAKWIALAAIEGMLAVVLFLLIREAFSRMEWSTADTHVYEILCTKAKVVNDILPSFAKFPQDRLPKCAEPSFNARLYLIMGVFKEIQAKSLETLQKTSSLSTSFLTCAVAILRFMVPGKPTCQHVNNQALETDKAAWKAKMRDEAAYMVMVLQFILFFLLGCLVNRLRAVFGPVMMAVAASCFGFRVWHLHPQFRRFMTSSCSGADQRGRSKAQSTSKVTQWAPFAILLVLQLGQVCWLCWYLPCISPDEGMCFHLEDRVTQNGDTMDLIDWMNRRLDPRLAVLCSMGTSGQVRAFTDNPLIIHPQFESEGLRKRVQTAYELYHCGSEESLLETTQSLRADIIIFEYYRCFITPYTLDDKSKNCDRRRHTNDDLLCYKLHMVSTKYFELLFANGGYAVFAVRPDGSASVTPDAADKRMSSSPMAARWKHYIDRCADEQGAECAGRLGELAATWHDGLKKPREAAIIRTLARERFPDDPHLAYLEGRHFDFNVNQPEKAGEYYAKALAGLPNNPVVLKEYLMWLDLSAKDPRAIKRLLEARLHNRGDGRLSLLELDRFAGAGAFFCEAAVSAKTVGLKDLSWRLWKRALELVPLSKCVKTNWAMMGSSTSYESTYTVWHKVRLLGKIGTDHTINSHNSPGTRYGEAGRFLLLPKRGNETLPAGTRSEL